MDSNTLVLLVTGSIGGLLYGLLGMGGGLVVIPVLIYLLGFSSQRATGTSLAAMLLPVGLGAVLEYARHGSIDWRAAVIIAVTLFLGSLIGACLANKLSAPTLQLIFSFFMIGIGFYSLAKSTRQIRSASATNRRTESSAHVPAAQTP